MSQLIEQVPATATNSVWCWVKSTCRAAFGRRPAQSPIAPIAQAAPTVKSAPVDADDDAVTLCVAEAATISPTAFGAAPEVSVINEAAPSAAAVVRAAPRKLAIDIDALVETELPPLPGSALRVAMLSLDLNVSTTAVAAAIGCDPILAARILRAANSPLYAVERKFTSLPSAVNALGNLAINQLVVIYAVSDAFHQNTKHSRLERPLWRHSVAVGVTAREIAAAINSRSGDEAFLCGLLHDVGKLLLLRRDADVYAQIEEPLTEQERTELEREIYNFTHAEVGALVARRWGLDEELGRAIFNHHHQAPSALANSTLTLIVEAADKMANYSGMSMRRDETAATDLAADEAIVALRLTPEQVREIQERAEISLDEMMSVLSSLI